LEQSLHDFEIIIGDNASTDQTVEVLQPYLSDPRITLIRRDKNLGLADNIHDLVVNRATCDLAVILSDDDYFIDRNYLITAINILEADKTTGFVHGEIEYEDHLGFKSPNKRRELPSFITGKDFFMGFGTAEHNYAYLMTVVFRKSLAKKVQIFSRPNIPHGDSLAWLMMSTTCNVKFVERVVARYCIHGSNAITSSNTAVWIDDIKFINIAYNYALDQTDWDRKELNSWLKRQRRTYCGKVLRMLRQEPTWRGYLSKISQLQKEQKLTNDPILITDTIKSIISKILKGCV
jgi:glycosyltransferase involved in cell wall biosynthesis